MEGKILITCCLATQFGIAKRNSKIHRWLQGYDFYRQTVANMNFRRDPFVDLHLFPLPFKSQSSIQ